MVFGCIASLMAIVFVLLHAAEALAWGPGVHLATGNYLLAEAARFGPAVAALLGQHPGAFLYGCLSADIFIGKGSTFTPRHSHNWSTGFRLLNQSRTPLLAAYAYGYLTHLAADIVAHNYYVPAMLGITPGGGKLSHVLVEMRADWEVDWSPGQARGVFRAMHREEDAVLLASLQRPHLPFLLKKQLYRRGFPLSAPNGLASRLAQVRLRFPQTRALLVPGRFCNDDYCREMLDLTLAVAAEFLREPETSAAVQFDPIGSNALATVKSLRREQRGEAAVPELNRLFPLPGCLLRLLPAFPRVFRSEEDVAPASPPPSSCSYGEDAPE